MKVLIACKVFEDELRACLPPGIDPVHIVWLETALDVDLDQFEKRLQETLEKLSGSPEDIHLLYGTGCHPKIGRMAERHDAVIAPVKNCIEAFCRGKTRNLERDRTMIMTPGWIRAWPDIMKALGWNEIDVRINLGRYDRILLLDPGVNSLSDEEILAFFDLVQVPVEIQPLDLQGFRETLKEIFTRRRCHRYGSSFSSWFHCENLFSCNSAIS